MDNNKVNQLIGLIYDAAMEPSKWSDLLNSLAEYVDYVDRQTPLSNPDHDALSVMPGISVIEDKEPQVTISEALKSITGINDGEGSDDGQAEIGD
ncbi:MAG: hypothetical protein KAU21_20650, partial [Gammaproteobacteria bacterium]|nr:hypothetical protein [Gammaproteobacteria bacterium]